MLFLAKMPPQRVVCLLVCFLLYPAREFGLVTSAEKVVQEPDVVLWHHQVPETGLEKRASEQALEKSNLTTKSTQNAQSDSDLDSCVSEVYPCSNYIMGNLVLIVYYGLTLAFSAKMISDGAEMLLDLGLAPALIGGVILPVSGVVPDSMMILVSGLGTKAAAQDQISVGMGTLAGSTILLLTLAWSISLYVGRVDLVAAPTCFGLVANNESRCTGVSLKYQGVEITKEVTISAFVMMVTMVPYFIIQSADWYFGPTLIREQQPGYVSAAALITFIFSITGFVLYLAMQFKLAQEGSNVRMTVHAKEKEQEMLLKAAKAFYMANILKASRGTGQGTMFGGGGRGGGVSKTSPWGGNQTGSVGGYEQLLDSTEHRDHILEKKYFATWRIMARMRKHRRDTYAHYGAIEETPMANQSDGSNAGTGMEMGKMQNGGPVQTSGGGGDKGGEEGGSSSSKESRGKILFKSLALLGTGIGMVTVFSDPMCDTLSRITDRRNPQFLPISPFYVSFIVTPLCSNASEIISSISFAMKKEKDNLILTYTQLYSAAIMNNTLCLGVFCGLVFFRSLNWSFSAEVTAILIVETLMGCLALKYRKVYPLWLAIPVAGIYFMSLAIVAFLEKVLKWG
ncbi:uncharacterized protein LOC142345770 [Convolutriloba macropyga]|uniref:uncharacterized protein LOC142345770 n=1 Tax=Convolutriloba macropyga TaxID=536237 RepID=UPI003F52484F